MKKILTVSNLQKQFIDTKEVIDVIDDINFYIYKGEKIAIIGMSGCGKSTLLNILAGLDKPTKGNITFDKANEQISYMLQNDALLPFKDVLSNACLGLELLHKKDENNINYVKELLDKYGLNGFLNKKPDELSGGMKQRVG